MIPRIFAVFSAFVLAGFSLGHSQNVSTPVVGFVKTSAAPSSDTMIAPQVMRASELSASVSSVTVAGDGLTATLALSGTTLTTDQFKYVVNTQPKTYFALVKSGNMAGAYFVVSSNTTSGLVVNLDGLTLGNADVTSVEVRPFWTLNTLFPPSEANVPFVPSTSTTTAGRRTQILIPDNTSTGSNRNPSKVFFYNNTLGDWVTTTAASVKAGDTVIDPAGYVILRNTGGTPPTLSITSSGSVLTDKVDIYLATASNKSNDNYIALPRASDYKLSELGFTDTNFVQSTSKTTGGRRDTLLVLDKTGAGINRAPSKVYFKFGGAWYDSSASATAVDPTIPAGTALVVRKFTSDGYDKVVGNISNFTP